MATASIEDLILALDWSGGDFDNEAYLCLRTGELFLHSGFGDNEEPLPDDIEDAEKYVCLPNKRDLGLGKPLAIRFSAEALSDDLDQVRDIFRQRGAYARFKELLDHRGILEKWYEFERANQEKELRRWCAAEGIELSS